MSLNVTGGFINKPRWLSEAIAIYEARGFVDPKRLQYIVEGDYPLSELDSEFGTGGNRIYCVSYVLTEYIVDR